jgi:transmembrane sensor
MSEVVRLRTRAEIEEAAAAWIWRMDEASPDVGREAFEAWLRQDPRHRRAVEELTKTWDALDGLAGTQRAPAPLPAEPPDGLTRAGRFPGTRRQWWLAAAAALVASVGGVVWLYHGNATQTLATAVGEHRNITLSDGTRLTLNTNTILETSFSRHTRSIHLSQGEAHFEVASDRSRPFLVHAGATVVQAIGTEFEVRLHADRHVDVLVNQGRVEVRADMSADPGGRAPGASAEPLPVVTIRALNAGQQLSTATGNYAIVPVSPEQVSSELAWRDGAVVFDSAPLAAAIIEIQRYTDARIIISDPQIGALPVGGRFKTDDLQGFLDGLEAALPITIRRTPDGVIYVDPHH